VLLKIVQLNLQMHEVVYFVLCMNPSTEQNAEWLDVPIKKLLESRHASNTVQIGPDSRPVHLARSFQDFGGWFGDQVKPYHGSHLQHQILNAMTRTCQRFNVQIISLPAGFIASKLSVLHVES
jgi:hypothetical protein